MVLLEILSTKLLSMVSATPAILSTTYLTNHSLDYQAAETALLVRSPHAVAVRERQKKPSRAWPRGKHSKSLLRMFSSAVRITSRAQRVSSSLYC